jgi:hypothetical protein
MDEFMKIHSERNAVYIHEYGISAELRFESLENASCYGLGIVTTIGNEDF